MLSIAWIPGPLEWVIIVGCCGGFLLVAAGIGVVIYLVVKKSHRDGPPRN